MVVLLAAAVSLSQTPAWQSLPNVFAKGFVRSAQGQKNSFQAGISGGDKIFIGKHAIGRDLAGVNRTEVADKEGVFTWVGSDPRYLLQLPVSTTEEYFNGLQTPKFTKYELLRYPEIIAQMIGGEVKIEKMKAWVLGREAIVVNVVTGGLITRVWLDAATGAVLKQQELQGESVIAEKELEAFEGKAGEGLPTKPQGTVIKGIPLPNILLYADQEGDAEADAQQMKKSVKLKYKDWIKTPKPIKGFKYIQTDEWSAGSRPIPPKEVDASAPAEAAFTLRSDDGQRVRAFQEFTITTQRTVEADLVLTARGDGDGLTILSGLPVIGRTFAGSPLRQEIEGGAAAYIQSDYLDPATGDTVSFLQVANCNAERFFRGIKLPKPVAAQGVETFQITTPFKLNIVAWRNGDATYALVSTRHSIEELVKLAPAFR